MLKKSLLISLAVIIAIVGGVAYWQRDLIKAYYMSTQMSKEEIKEQMVDSKKVLEEAAGLEIREFTDEEKNEIESGSTTENEVISKIITEGTQKAQESKGNNQNQVNTPVDPVKETTTKYVTQVYALQAEYVSKLEGFANKVKSDYEGMAKEMKSSEAKKKIMSKYLNEVASLERECDSRFSTIITSLESELKNLNANTDIIKTIKKAYLDEKNLKRAYYMTYIS